MILTRSTGTVPRNVHVTTHLILILSLWDILLPPTYGLGKWGRVRSNILAKATSRFEPGLLECNGALLPIIERHLRRDKKARLTGVDKYLGSMEEGGTLCLGEKLPGASLGERPVGRWSVNCELSCPEDQRLLLGLSVRMEKQHGQW